MTYGISYFNSRAHVERDRRGRSHRSSAVYFNSRAHVERDAYNYIKIYENCDFNSRAHVERDPTARFFARAKSNFNSRAHVERDRLAGRRNPPRAVFQLTRSRGARPHTWRASFHISPFQLTRSRGARRPPIRRGRLACVISTHALTWSATQRETGHLIRDRDFNSRAHVERDRWILQLLHR